MGLIVGGMAVEHGKAVLQTMIRLPNQAIMNLTYIWLHFVNGKEPSPLCATFTRRASGRTWESYDYTR
jgi:hypothetical protein